MEHPKIGRLQPDAIGRWSGSIRLPAFAGWGARWEGGRLPTDRDTTARAGVFSLVIDAFPAGRLPTTEQLEAFEWLLHHQDALSHRIAMALVDHLRLFVEAGAIGSDEARELTAIDGVRDQFLLQQVEVRDPARGRRRLDSGVALVRLSFASSVCPHIDDHGLEAVVGVSGEVRVGDQGTL